MEAGRTTGFGAMFARNSESISIKINVQQETYTLIKVNEFDSDKKMMSVVVKNDKTGKVYAFNKGADVSILPLLKDRETAEYAK